MSSVVTAETTLVATLAPPDAPQVVVTEAQILATTLSEQNSVWGGETVILAAYATGPRADYKQRAWHFTFDGHPFYVLTLGTLGTYVYDISTQQWAQFSTVGYGVWNMEYGVEWDGGVVAGDNTLPNIWRLNPDSFIDDDFRPMTRVATGGVQRNARETLRTGSYNLSVALQDPSTVSAITLRISDDEGKTYFNQGTISITNANQEIAWRSLGLVRYPGRVFRVEDTDGGVRIDGSQLITNEG